jgi:hypothetical protein
MHSLGALIGPGGKVIQNYKSYWNNDCYQWRSNYRRRCNRNFRNESCWNWSVLAKLNRSLSPQIEWVIWC